MNTIRIRYCTQCHWMLRAAWMAQELLSTFPTQIAQMILEPGKDGIFEIWVGDERVWERKQDGGFPDIRRLKQIVRDRIAPELSLGHLDKIDSASND